ncbi:4'-phosphopantetheinyl transferase superfamily protein [Candidatus Gracilibacteria bacterium]|nr:4'-phosphopantetheinyl transferase superfamily protein [candidate division SR1 bacterium]MBF0981345.1 4'-phosphopantetheinyl transferase superfamily protein [Candidatus Gracilibacteria bacterium]
MDLFLRKFDKPIGEKSDSPYALHKQAKNQILIDHYQLGENDGVLLEQIEKNHGKKSDFFSASYSDRWLFLAFSEEKIGVDIEQIKPRTSSLLDKRSEELKLLGEESWDNFYRLWTAKEALLKAANAENLDQIWNIQLVKEKNTSEPSFQVYFDKILFLELNNQQYEVKSFCHENLIGAVCIIPH